MSIAAKVCHETGRTSCAAPARLRWWLRRLQRCRGALEASSGQPIIHMHMTARARSVSSPRARARCACTILRTRLAQRRARTCVWSLHAKSCCVVVNLAVCSIVAYTRALIVHLLHRHAAQYIRAHSVDVSTKMTLDPQRRSIRRFLLALLVRLL